MMKDRLWGFVDLPGAWIQISSGEKQLWWRVMLGQLRFLGECTNSMIAALRKNATIWKYCSDLHEMMKNGASILD